MYLYNYKLYLNILCKRICIMYYNFQIIKIWKDRTEKVHSGYFWARGLGLIPFSHYLSKWILFVCN